MNISNVIGPFLCKPTQAGISFWLHSSDFNDDTQIRVLVSKDNFSTESSFKKLSNSKYNVWLADLIGLNADTEYRYVIMINGKVELLGLAEEDYVFRTLPTEVKGQPLDFVLMSCHGIEEFEKKNPNEKHKAWILWDRLLSDLKINRNLYFAVLGGDQVYMDEEFEGNMTFASNGEDDFRSRILKVYKKYWQHPSYRKVFARIPAFLMWDDHDLIDGFGSRPEQFNKKGKEDTDWTSYRKKLTEAFYEFQACRNPGWNGDSRGPFTFSTKIGGCGFIGMDLRSERNVVLSRLLSENHKKNIQDSVESLSTNGVINLFFVSPVTFARMGGEIEHAIGRVANYLWKLSSRLGWNLNIFKPAVWWFFSSILFLSVQMKFHGNAGYYSSFILWLVLLILLIADYRTKVNYLSNKATIFWRKVLFGSFLLLSAGIAYCWDWKLIQSLDYKQVLDESFGEARHAFKIIVPMFLTLLVAFLHTKTESKKIKPWLFRLMLVFLVVTLAALMWVGMPNSKSDLIVWLKLIPNAIVQLIGFLFFIFAFGEATGAIDLIAGLDDDIKDSWSSEVNSSELQWFRTVVVDVWNRNIRPVILAGDIHTGGVSKISFDKNFKNTDDVLTQVVSSPMSYVPMENIVEKMTSSNSVNQLTSVGDEMYAYNLFYRCQRNYAIIRTKYGEKALHVSFSFEDVLAEETIKC